MNWIIIIVIIALILGWFLLGSKNQTSARCGCSSNQGQVSRIRCPRGSDVLYQVGTNTPIGCVDNRGRDVKPLSN